MLNQNNESVAAIIPTYNRKHLLDECLRALLLQTRSLDAIIIVDNASTDGTNELLLENGYFNIPTIDYIRLPDNTGSSGGFHEGIKRGFERKFDWLWLMDDDAEPKEDALEKLFASGMHLPSDTVSLSSLIIESDNTIDRGMRGHYNIYLSRQFPLDECSYNKYICKIGYSSYVGMMLKSNILDVVGFPRKDFFAFFDDIEFCLRLSKCGNLYLIKDSVVLHKNIFLKSNQNNRILIQNYWRIYYSFRNPILILLIHNTNMMGLLFGYLKIIFRLFRNILAIIFFDKYKLYRIRTLIKAFSHGCTFHSGKEELHIPSKCY